jgi:hypothetical protein
VCARARVSDKYVYYLSQRVICIIIPSKYVGDYLFQVVRTFPVVNLFLVLFFKFWKNLKKIRKDHLHYKFLKPWECYINITLGWTVAF